MLLAGCRVKGTPKLLARQMKDSRCALFHILTVAQDLLAGLNLQAEVMGADLLSAGCWHTRIRKSGADPGAAVAESDYG